MLHTCMADYNYGIFKNFLMKNRLTGIILIFTAFISLNALAQGNVFGVNGSQTTLNGKPITVLGLRCSNALLSDTSTTDLIEYLDVYKRYGLNTVSVFVMGSRYGDIKGYNEDASLNEKFMVRLARIIEAADKLEMIVLVGCLYWGGSKAKWELWEQKDAERAIFNTVLWLAENNYRNVFIDVDNEGMGKKFKEFDQAGLVKSAKKADSSYFVATNFKGDPPPAADLGIHFSNKVPGKPYIESEGTPDNAPGNYWGAYSKKPPLYNYINIGVYTDEMKQRQIIMTKECLDKGWGYMMASTWLQCVPPHGPNAYPGGDGSEENPGIRWWLEAVKEMMVKD